MPVGCFPSFRKKFKKLNKGKAPLPRKEEADAEASQNNNIKQVEANNRVEATAETAVKAEASESPAPETEGKEELLKPPEALQNNFDNAENATEQRGESEKMLPLGTTDRVQEAEEPLESKVPHDGSSPNEIEVKHLEANGFQSAPPSSSEVVTEVVNRQELESPLEVAKTMENAMEMEAEPSRAQDMIENSFDKEEDATKQSRESEEARSTTSDPTEKVQEAEEPLESEVIHDSSSANEIKAEHMEAGEFQSALPPSNEAVTEILDRQENLPPLENESPLKEAEPMENVKETEAEFSQPQDLIQDTFDNEAEVCKHPVDSEEERVITSDPTEGVQESGELIESQIPNHISLTNETETEHLKENESTELVTEIMDPQENIPSQENESLLEMATPTDNVKETEAELSQPQDLSQDTFDNEATVAKQPEESEEKRMITSDPTEGVQEWGTETEHLKDNESTEVVNEVVNRQENESPLELATPIDNLKETEAEPSQAEHIVQNNFDKEENAAKQSEVAEEASLIASETTETVQEAKESPESQVQRDLSSVNDIEAESQSTLPPSSEAVAEFVDSHENVPSQKNETPLEISTPKDNAKGIEAESSQSEPLIQDDFDHGKDATKQPEVSDGDWLIKSEPIQGVQEVGDTIVPQIRDDIGSPNEIEADTLETGESQYAPPPTTEVMIKSEDIDKSLPSESSGPTLEVTTSPEGVKEQLEAMEVNRDDIPVTEEHTLECREAEHTDSRPEKPTEIQSSGLPEGLHWMLVSVPLPEGAIDINELHLPIHIGLVETCKGEIPCKYLEKNRSFYAGIDGREEDFAHGKILCFDSNAAQAIELEWVHSSTSDIRSRNHVVGAKDANGKPMYIARGMIPLTGPHPYYELSAGWVSEDLDEAHLAFGGAEWHQRDFDVLAWKPRC